MANIGPAMSFYFGFGYLAYTAGLASPLTIILAGVAILFLGNTLSEFCKVLPSTGGFISFIGKTFGGRTAVTTALMTGAGYIAAMASVVAIVGGFFQIILKNYNVSGLENVPWIIWTLVFLAFAVFMMIRGVSISTRIAGIFFAFEMLVLIVVSVVALIKFHGSITLPTVRTQEHPQRLQWTRPPGSRSPSTSSSDGRTRRRWPKRPTIRARTSRGPSSRRRSSCWSPTSCSRSRRWSGSRTTWRT